MAKASPSPSSAKRSGASKEATAAPSRSRSTKTLAAPVPPPLPAPEVSELVALTDRFNTIEEKLTTSMSSLMTELSTLKATAPVPSSAQEAPSDTFLPVMADIVRRTMMEHLSPIAAALKRLEERVGFIGNRLKHPGGGGGGGGGGQEQRQKPWRHDHSQRHGRPRGHGGHNNPRGGQPPPQSWTPPSAASVQGHFAPRPLPGRDDPAIPDED